MILCILAHPKAEYQICPLLTKMGAAPQIGEGEVCAIPYGNEMLCPVKALTAWQACTGMTSGVVFRGIDRHENISEKPLTAQSINLIIKTLAGACDIPNARAFSAHSLRRGFATTASKKGIAFPTIMRHGRWKHEGTVMGYIEEGQRFEENAAKIIINKHNG